MIEIRPCLKHVNTSKRRAFFRRDGGFFLASQKNSAPLGIFPCFKQGLMKYIINRIGIKMKKFPGLCKHPGNFFISLLL